MVHWSAFSAVLSVFCWVELLAHSSAVMQVLSKHWKRGRCWKIQPKNWITAVLQSLFLAQESDEAVLDAFFHRFKTVILRQDAAVAQQDVLAAIEAQEEVARQAHEAWKKQRKAERKEKVEAFKADIKQKFDDWQPS